MKKLSKPPKPPTEKVKELKKERNFMKGIKNKLLDKFRPSKTLLIEMMHMNGTLTHFIIAPGTHKFNYKKNVYVIDETKKIYNNSSKLYMLRYHEGFCLPYNFNISAQGFKDAIREDEFKDIRNSFNPNVLKDVIKMRYATGVLTAGSEISNLFKRTFVVCIVNLLALLILAVAWMWKEGII